MKMQGCWKKRVKLEFEKPYMKELQSFLSDELTSGHTIYPSKENVFKALCATCFEEVKVVIVGQDPYHNPDQAHGLSFSVKKGVKPPPSLQNIYKELNDDLNVPIPSHGNLESWAKNGVLLLNSTLTVRANEPRSHYGKGWEQFTDAVIQAVAEQSTPTVFMLWGQHAQKKCETILADTKQHLVLKAAHPSPFSANTGFLGCKHFSKANEFLSKNDVAPVNWQID
ncbi:MAG: uracil-DNA glycosylase [Chlamydiota bacterium]|jgi:uracil-DNA glycosylase